ncbi:MAG TPA: Zn-dependent alcohol dehydrogenase [Actinomycetota bacterium]
MRAAVLTEQGSPLILADVDLAPPGPGEVLVRIAATGVCHSDLSMRDGGLQWPLPAVIGHEAAGEVLDAGEGVRTVSAGDHVVISWIPMCRRCFFCTGGQPHLCSTYRRANGRMDDGATRLTLEGREVTHGFNAATFAERTVVREASLVRIPKDVPLETASLIGCGVLTGVGAALNTARIQPGERVAVIGCGAVGLSVIQGCRLAGASVIIAIDPVEAKREAALSMGATHAVTPEEADAAAKDLTGGVRPDAVFEVVGIPALQRQAFDLVRPGGRAVMVGAAPVTEEVALPTVGFLMFEKRALGCYYGSSDPQRDVPRILELWRGGRLELEALISARRPLEQVNEALDAMADGTTIRTVLIP